jgi:outer membrane receptor protein involved in Fe transport
MNPSFIQEKLKAYALVDARVAFPNFVGNTVASLSVTNLFDTDYIEVFGFTTLGRNLNLSLSYSF